VRLDGEVPKNRFRGEVTSDLKWREEGVRNQAQREWELGEAVRQGRFTTVGSVLRAEDDDPTKEQSFRVYRSKEGDARGKKSWACVCVAEWPICTGAAGDLPPGGGTAIWMRWPMWMNRALWKNWVQRPGTTENNGKDDEWRALASVRRRSCAAAGIDQPGRVSP